MLKDVGENFSLAEFMASGGTTLLERVQPFSDYYRASLAAGLALYGRELMGPCENRTRVKDHRSGAVTEMIMLGSNNYLGLTTHPHVREAVERAVADFGSGMGGPPLLNGTSSLHRELERRLAALKAGPRPAQEMDCLLFASGFQANIGWLSALAREGDVLIYDELSHASLYDGVALMGPRIKAFRFRHNDCAHLKTLLTRFNAGKKPGAQIFVAIEGVYSMDGDLPPLHEIAALCHTHQATLMMDDAHGTGVMGAHGGGVADHFELDDVVDLHLGTFSKTFGVTGGFIVARREIIDYMRFFSRSYMFSAHLPPTTAAAVLAALDIIEREPERRTRLDENASYLHGRLKGLGLTVKRGGAIVPVLVPEHIDIRELARRIHEEGVFLNAIEYPAVPKDQQRLRLSVMATHTKDDLDAAVAVIEKMLGEFPWLA